MTPAHQQVVREVHPEVCFWAMAGGQPMPRGKTSAQGERDRQEALIGAGFPPTFIGNMATELRVGRDDFLDACAALWTARRIVDGKAGRFPAEAEVDARGPDQAIWF